REMFGLRVPIVCTVIGEGGSGGALGLGIGDRLLMFEHSVYTVATPEACAAILWRDSAKAPIAAEALKITAPDLLRLEIIDEILPEPLGGAHRYPLEAAAVLKAALSKALTEIGAIAADTRLEKRYHKFRRMGVFLETAAVEESENWAVRSPKFP
ncbi:MAG TPA: acetyl-CoA carboxylase carboxyl transferase subunit alpha, partial [Cyanobacteria bacterium UBA8156]|nr:acetyl-CoA carboxylase carboxyl transferase subunit alpha [Cyanobacteria bacterium UBA8156]